MTPETRLAIALCRIPLSDATRRVIESSLTGKIDWNALIRRICQWEMEPVAFSNLRTQFSETIPPAVLQSISLLERDSRARALTNTLLLVEVVKELERAGIGVVVLKGPSVAIPAYGDVSLRPFADFDLLVRYEDLSVARVLLMSTGYAAAYDPKVEGALIRDQHALEFSRGREKIELHWALLSRHLQLDFDLDDLWRSAQTIPCAGAHIRVLAPHHLFLFLCAHGAKHEWVGMRWIVDVLQLGRKLSSDEARAVVALAARTNSRRVLALALRVARDILGEDFPQFSGAVLGPESDTRALVELVRKRLAIDFPASARAPGLLSRIKPGLPTLLFWASARERARDRVACFAHVLFVPTDNDKGPVLLRWIGRPLRLASRALRITVLR